MEIEIKDFNQFGFIDGLNEGLEAMGFKEPTPIQVQAIPKIIANKDLVACAQTGTGKTAAYVLPVLHKIASEPSKAKVRAVVVAPTRELVIQIDQQIEGFSYFTNTSSIAVYGGNDATAFEQQKQAILQGVDIVVATPGRLLVLLTLEDDVFDHIEYLILDEADRMLDMGFMDDIQRIINFLPAERQTLLFSATMPPKIRNLAQNILKKPEEVSIAVSQTADGVTQKAFTVLDKQKVPLLKFFLDSGQFKSVIVFASTKSSVKAIEQASKNTDMDVEAFHSDLDQAERELVMRKFRAGSVNVLIATDILSRGIDVENIDLVVNFDVPPDAEDYVHRVGRTARAARRGMAITLINEKDMYLFDKIERLIGKDIAKTSSLPGRLGEGPEYKLFAKKDRKGRSRKR